MSRGGRQQGQGAVRGPGAEGGRRAFNGVACFSPNITLGRELGLE